MRALTLLCLFWVGQAFAIEFNKYHSQTEINDYMKQVAEQHPDLVTFEKLGVSDKGRDLNFVLITHADIQTAPAIYLNGTHHGNEKSSTETTLGVIDYFLSHQLDVDVRELLEKYVFIIQPLVNADGHASNTREDAFGRDPNRDYSYPGSSESEDFKSPFIRLVRGLLDRFRVRAAVAYHSGMVGVLWPWCASSSPTQMQDTFHTLSKIAALGMGMNYYRQSYFDYPTYGEFSDYAFMKHGTLAVTFEVSKALNPPTSQLPSVVKNAVQGTMAFIRAVRDLDAGRLALEAAPHYSRKTTQFNPLFERLGRRVE